jgi:hypothetical protein
MANFGKPLPEFSHDELLDGLNNWNPQFGALAALELQRRIAVENSSSSKRFARWSLILSVVAVLISFCFGGVQVYLASIQTIPVFQNLAKEDRRELSFCLQNIDSILIFPDDATTTCRNYLHKRGYLLEQLNLYPLNILLSSTSTTQGFQGKVL